MAKGKRGSHRRQVSRERISQAKYAKEHGLISKRAKLGNGRLSRAVEKKVENLSILGALPQYEFRAGMKRAAVSQKPTAIAIKLPTKLKSDAKAKGYQIFGGQIIAPKSERKAFEKAISHGRLAGSVETEGGSLFRVSLAGNGIHSYSQLIESLKEGELDDIVGDNLFSFTFRDYHPKSGRVFLDGAELAAYLEHYQWSEEEFDDFELWVVPEGESLGPTPDYVYDRDRASGRIKPRKRKRSRRAMETQVIGRAKQSEEVRKAKAAERQRKHRAKLKRKLGEQDYKEFMRTDRAKYWPRKPK